MTVNLLRLMDKLSSRGSGKVNIQLLLISTSNNCDFFLKIAVKMLKLIWHLVFCRYESDDRSWFKYFRIFLDYCNQDPWDRRKHSLMLVEVVEDFDRQKTSLGCGSGHGNHSIFEPGFAPLLLFIFLLPFAYKVLHPTNDSSTTSTTDNTLWRRPTYSTTVTDWPALPTP